eukprot:176760-Rhodomonas_salina.1
MPSVQATSHLSSTITSPSLSSAASNAAPRMDGGEGGELRLQEMNCDFCAARKIKCSREKTCNQCRGRGRTCTYSRCATGSNIRPIADASNAKVGDIGPQP